MASLFINLGSKLFLRLLTESFAAKMIVYSLSEIAKSTKNQLDDKIVGAVADALSVKISEDK